MKNFSREFGRRSVDVYLPDCFGFGWALPSIMAHSGLTGFSTQKRTWGSASWVCTLSEITTSLIVRPWTDRPQLTVSALVGYAVARSSRMGK